MICPKCSYDIEPGAAVCSNCGFTFLNPPVNPARREDYPEPPRRAEYPAGVFAPTYIPSAAVDYAPAPRAESGANALSVSAYVFMLLLSFLPVAGFITCAVLALRKSTNIHRRRLAGAIVILKLLFLLFALGAVLMYLFWYTPVLYYVLNR